MQKNVPKYTPSWVADRAALGGDIEAGRVVRAVQRPPHAAVVRQPARHRVPPDAGLGPSGPTTPRTSCSTSIRRSRTRLRDGGAGRAPGAPGARRARARRRGEDERRQGRARVRADRRRGVDGGRGRGDPGHRGAAPNGSIPSIATTAFMKEDRGGKVFVDSTRVGGATVVAAYSPRVRPGVPVSFPVAGTTSTASRPATSPSTRRCELLGDSDPWAAHMPAPQHAAAPTSSPKGTPSRSRGCKPCTRASDEPAPAAHPRATFEHSDDRQ